MDNSTLELESVIGKESHEHEYKKFVLQSHIMTKLNISDILIYIENPIIDDMMYDMLYSNLKTYINKYFPKYFASASRSKSKKSKFCKLSIGISDDGTISGIPWRGQLTKKVIYDLIENEIKNIRGVFCGINSDTVLEEYLDLLTVTVTKCTTHTCTGTKSHKSIISFIEKQEKYESAMANYYQQLALWKQEMAFYCTSLEIISNEPTRRNNFLQYCIDNNASDEVIDLLKSDSYISIEIGVHLRKVVETSYEYWITTYKDFHIARLKSIKPQMPDHQDDISVKLNNYFSNIDSMNNCWINANYYVVTINLPFNIISDKWIEYKEKREWVSRCRSIKADGEPFTSKI